MDLNKQNMLQDLPSSSPGSKKHKANAALEGTVEALHARKICMKSTEDDEKNPIDGSLINAIGRDLTIRSLVHCPRYTYGRVATLNRSFRELVRGGDLYRERRRQDVVEHWVNFSCSQKCNWKAYDPICKEWIRLPALITNDPCFDFSDKESVGVGTQLLVLGNDMLGPGIYRYSIQANSWLPGQPMNVPRCLFGSASVKTEAFFAGGVDRTGRIVDTVERYDSETGVWTTLPSLLKPRKMSSGVFMDGKFYVIGGTGGGGQDKGVLTCGEEYDFNAKSWTEIPNMSPGGSMGSMAPPLIAVVENELYAADHRAMKLKLYKKKSNEWATIGRLPERVDHTEGWGIAFRGCGERLLILGGPRRDGEDTHLEIYSWVPSEGPPEWTLIGRKRTDSFVYNCTIMGC